MMVISEEYCGLYIIRVDKSCKSRDLLVWL